MFGSLSVPQTKENAGAFVRVTYNYVLSYCIKHLCVIFLYFDFVIQLYGSLIYFQMNVNPEDLLPKLPKPHDLQPFPMVESMVSDMPWYIPFYRLSVVRNTGVPVLATL